MCERNILVYVDQGAADFPRGRNTKLLLTSFENLTVQITTPVHKALVCWCRVYWGKKGSLADGWGEASQKRAYRATPLHSTFAGGRAVTLASILWLWLPYQLTFYTGGTCR